MNFKIFGLYDMEGIVVNDEGLKSVINLNPKLALKSHGRNVQKFGQAKVNVVERLINKLAVAGHRGKKHRIILGDSTGKYSKNAKIVLEALKMVESRTKKNPVEVLVRAVENAAPRDETTMIEYGGARYPQAVDVSPMRRISIALKHIIHGSSDKAFGKKKNISQALADEIVSASERNQDSFAIKKRVEAERQADSAR
ncbi:MAG: 30S ribosomal protein S7 [Nanoarchaeota archaeon]|nr:30S ribosomal protein S7 [Nanoarchaeota archaeon]